MAGDVDDGLLALLPVDTAETLGPVGLTTRTDTALSSSAQMLMQTIREVAAGEARLKTVARGRQKLYGRCILRGDRGRSRPSAPHNSEDISLAISTPPYRADHVGSLLRPAAVKAARKKFYDEKSISAEELKAVEDAAIIDAVKMQESIGLKAVTDGEMRRSFWHYDFMGQLDGFDLEEREPEAGVQFHGVNLRPIFPTITGKLDFPDNHPMLEHYKYLASVTKVTPKISIPGPSCCHFRTAKEDIHPAEYQDLEVLFADLAKTYAKAVKKFYEAGCRYLQMDDIFFAYLCDPSIFASRRRPRGSIPIG